MIHELSLRAIDWIENEYFPQEVGVQFSPLESIGAFMLQPLGWAAHTFVASEKREGANATLQKVIAVAAFLFTLPVTLVAIGCKLIGQRIRPPKCVRSEEVLPKADPHLVDGIYTILNEFSSLAKEQGIEYRICGGTALGAVRHAGMIPWDDDGDLFVLKEGFDKLIGLKEELQKRGILLEEKKELSALQFKFSKEGLKKHNLSQNGVIDVFLMKKEEKTGRVIFASPFFQAQFPREWCTIDEWDHPYEWSFGSKVRKFSLVGFSPEKAKEYLKRGFGDDCLDTAIHTHTHFCIFGITLPFPALYRERVVMINKDPAQGVEWK